MITINFYELEGNTKADKINHRLIWKLKSKSDESTTGERAREREREREKERERDCNYEANLKGSKKTFK